MDWLLYGLVDLEKLLIEILYFICFCQIFCFIYGLILGNCREKKTMIFLEAVLYLHLIILINSNRPVFSSTWHFTKEGHVFETQDADVLDIKPLLVNSLGECAMHCGMNALCIAFDFCSLNGSHTCRLRSGHTVPSNTATQCGLYEMTAVSTFLH